jgi:transcriptional regulator with PAS, ATPase and Fis domain
MFKGPRQVEELSRRINKLESDVEFYKREADALRDRRYGLDSLIGESQPMCRLRAEIVKVAPLEIPVLIRGESGTGKELVAHALHRLSPRRDAAMVMVNAAALPAALVESELFGYEPGAFTGADKRGRKGKFEQAGGGTIFLDEIGDMPIEIQSKLLRVLQDKMVERVGGAQPYEVDFRLVSATNRDLRGLVAEEKFRLDLYYRISTIVLEVPPLRSRISDIPLLAAEFLKEIAARHRRPPVEITPNAIDWLMEQAWPGNVRQLRHEIERAFVFSENGRITADTFAAYGEPQSDLSLQGPLRDRLPSKATPSRSDRPMSLKEAVEALEVDLVRKAMMNHRGNKKRVAEELGISRSYLYKKLGLAEEPES